MIRLDGPIREHLEETPSDVRAARIERAIAARRLRRAAPRSRVAAVAVAMAVVALLMVVARPEPTLTVAGGTRTLVDGAVLKTSPGAAVEILRSPKTVLFVLPAGDRVHLDIPPNTGRRWIVDAGVARVEVLGTEFSVARQEGRVEVQVVRGRVRVTSGALERGERVLESGERLLVEPVGPPALSTLLEPRFDLEPEVTQEPVAREPAPNRRQPAREGRSQEPRRAHGSARDPEPPNAPDPVATLLERADAARAEGATEEAVEHLLEIASAYPEDLRAGLAAFTAARLLLDVLDQPAAGARALDLALSLGLAEALYEPARARRFEALSASHDEGAARRAALEYLKHHPGGRNADAAAKLAGLR